MTKVFLLGNGTTPGYRCPSVAPGLRVYGLRHALVTNGIDATIVVPQEVIERRLQRWGLGPDVARQVEGTLVMSGSEIAEFLADSAPASVIMTNGVSVGMIEKKPSLRVGLDFFSATVLEHRYRGRGEEHLKRVIARKFEAIGRSDFFLVNGRRRVPYCHGWLAAAGLDVREQALIDVNMCLPAEFGALRDAPPARLSVAIVGYDQPWARLSPLLELLEILATRLPLKIFVVAADDYWDVSDTETQLSRTLARLMANPAFEVVPPMDYESLGTLLKSADLFLDLFDDNIERRYSMSTRTIMAVTHGVPVVHPEFTEVGALIAEHDAGWTTRGHLRDSLLTLESILKQALNEPGLLARKQQGARALARTAFNPVLEGRKLAPLVSAEPSPT